MVAREPTEGAAASQPPSDGIESDVESSESVISVASSAPTEELKLKVEPKAKRVVSDKQLEHLKKIRQLANERRAEKQAKAREAKEADAARKAAIAAKEKALADQKVRQETMYLKKLDKKLAKPATTQSDKKAKAVAPASAASEPATVASNDSALTQKIAELEKEVLKLKYKSKYGRGTPPGPRSKANVRGSEGGGAPLVEPPTFNLFGRY